MLRRAFRIGFLGTMLALAAAAAAPAHASDPFAGDVRVSSKHSLRFQNVVIRDLLADLHEQTGISFFADDALADDRVTVLTHDRPLADSLRALADFHQWQWRRDGPKADAGYTLNAGAGTGGASPGSFLEARLKALADLIYDEAAVYSETYTIPQKQREDLDAELPTRIAQEKNPAAARRLRIQARVLDDLRSGRQWKQPIYRFLATLSRDDIALMVHADTSFYSWPKLPGAPALPDATAEQLRYLLTHEFSTGQGFQIVALRLRLTPVIAAQEPVLRMNLLVDQRNNYGTNQYALPGVLPISYTLLAEDGGERSPIEPESWRSDASLAESISLHVGPEDPSRGAAALPPGSAGSEGYWLSDALAKIAADRPIDIIADGLWSTRISPTDFDAIPAGEALTKLCRATGHRWWQQDGFVMVRSRHYEAERWAEPPAISVQRWRDSAERGLFGLDDYAEMASLPDAQAMTLQSMSNAGMFPAMLSPLGTARSQLLLWSALAPAQRHQAQGDGLAYSKLKPAQQRLFLLALTDSYVMPVSPAVVDAGVLARANLKVRFQDSAHWGIHRTGFATNLRIPRGTDPANAIATREDAFRAFSRGDSSIKLEDVQPMTITVVTFRYDDDREGISQIYIQLPPRWETKE